MDEKNIFMLATLKLFVPLDANYWFICSISRLYALAEMTIIPVIIIMIHKSCFRLIINKPPQNILSVYHIWKNLSSSIALGQMYSTKELCLNLMGQKNSSCDKRAPFQLWVFFSSWYLTYTVIGFQPPLHMQFLFSCSFLLSLWGPAWIIVTT